MAATAALPKRSEVALEDTWNLETIFYDDGGLGSRF